MQSQQQPPKEIVTIAYPTSPAPSYTTAIPSHLAMGHPEPSPIPVSPGYVPPLYPSQSQAGQIPQVQMQQGGYPIPEHYSHPQMQQPQPQFQPQFQQQNQGEKGLSGPPGIPYQNVQPGGTPMMDPKNVKGLPRGPTGERDWSNGICDFTDDCGTCCLGWLCPCIVYAQNKSRIERLNQSGQPHPSGGDGFSGDCWLHCALTACLGAGWVLQIGSRGTIRERYRIGGDTCSDCMLAWCCAPCELTQEAQEIELEERALLGQPLTH